MANAVPYLERKIHPVVIISAFNRALEDAIKVIDDISVPIDVTNNDEMTKLIKATIGTKFVSRWSDLMCKLALDSVRCVATDVNGKREVDIKRYVRIEKVSFDCVISVCLHIFIYRFPAVNWKSLTCWMES